jgi:hypothetical protein
VRQQAERLLFVARSICIARSIQNAAKALVGTLENDQNFTSDWDCCPVVLLYRHAFEIHLAVLIGEGSTFLPGSHRPLHQALQDGLIKAQNVCRIIRAKVERRIYMRRRIATGHVCALVNEVETFGPVTQAILCFKDRQSISGYCRTFDVVNFVAKLDALLTLVVRHH